MQTGIYEVREALGVTYQNNRFPNGNQHVYIVEDEDNWGWINASPCYTGDVPRILHHARDGRQVYIGLRNIQGVRGLILHLGKLDNIRVVLWEDRLWRYDRLVKTSPDERFAGQSFAGKYEVVLEALVEADLARFNYTVADVEQLIAMDYSY